MTSVPRHHLPEAPLTDYSEAELRARVARAQMWALELRRVDGAPEPTSEQARDHLAYLNKLEAEGRLYGSGPVAPVDGSPGFELSIVVATSRTEAEAYAANDPLVQAGLATTDVTSHIINEGVACYFARELSRRAQESGSKFDPSFGSVTLTAEELEGRGQGVQLHLIRLKPGEKARPASDKQVGYNHFLWLRGNEMQAKLMSCGPFEVPHADGYWGGGLGVVAVGAEEAEEIRAAEPSGQIGYRSLSAEAWTLNYGLAAPIAKALRQLNDI